MPSPFRIVYQQRRHPYHFKIRKSMKDKDSLSRAFLFFSAHVSANMIEDAIYIKK
jgi:hypothetical protein